MHAWDLSMGCIVTQMHTLDAVDARILLARDHSTDASIVDTAAQLGLSRNTIQSRLKRLRDSGCLGVPSASVLHEAAGRPLLAFVTLSVLQQNIETVYAALAAIPEVVEAHTTTGEADLMIRVVARDTIDLHRITQQIQLAHGVQRSSTSIATTQVIEHRMSPLLQTIAVST